MYVLIDDIRDLNADIICRTPDGAKLTLQGLALVKYTLGIDHDLSSKETGYDILRWAIDERLLPDNIQLVTMNPIGKKNMIYLLFDNGYTSFDNTNFVKDN